VTPVASARPAVQVPDLQQAVADILEHDAQRTAYIEALEQHGERAARELEHERQEAGKLRARVGELEAQPEVAEAVRRLDAIHGGEPEGAHSEADEILLACVPLEVREAHQRLVERAAWWACA
jgi:hypothetical protein